MGVHCPRASNGPLPRRSNLVGYVRWDAQSDRFPPCQTIIPTAFRSQSELPTVRELSPVGSNRMPGANTPTVRGSCIQINCPLNLLVPKYRSFDDVHLV